jgi:hypothetical protein
MVSFDKVHFGKKQCNQPCTRPQQSWEFLEQLLYMGQESGGGLWAPGFNDEATLALEKVQPEADYKTCCSEGMM